MTVFCDRLVKKSGNIVEAADTYIHTYIYIHTNELFKVA